LRSIDPRISKVRVFARKKKVLLLRKEKKRQQSWTDLGTPSAKPVPREGQAQALAGAAGCKL